MLHSRAISSHTCARVPEHAGGPRRYVSSCGKRRAHGPARLRALGVGACDHAESTFSALQDGQHGDTRVVSVPPGKTVRTPAVGAQIRASRSMRSSPPAGAGTDARRPPFAILVQISRSDCHETVFRSCFWRSGRQTAVEEVPTGRQQPSTTEGWKGKTKADTAV